MWFDHGSTHLFVVVLIGLTGFGDHKWLSLRCTKFFGEVRNRVSLTKT